MKTSRLIIVVALVGLFSVSAGGATTWWMLKNRGAPPAGAPPEAAPKTVTDTRAFKYVSLEKVIVMLRNKAGEPVSHYLALDLVFMTPTESERVTRDHLPLLRSVTVKELSQLTMETASHLSVEELTGRINQAYQQTYADDPAGMPFAEAMIGKLIIE
ncbi:MAG TPA: flagellar basal body-associated FliL family protein [Povalibacter sp.]|uniref:flagellar basal body-associated FliL family protein n=1 Tax=Povalibacter sp. TaxID=1962978 RepID=UPI002C6536DA|nr:flagellar basal body-associated FliL family protein [Povalibacter sp.]HMN43147.1 flagellar basal body-associated FliL family protein [Povalibacter sp.]